MKCCSYMAFPVMFSTAEVLLFLFITILILVLSYYLCFIWDFRNSREAKALCVIHLVEVLGQVCPIGTIKKWKLLYSDVKIRCWFKTFPSKLWEQTLSMYGCSTIVKASSLAVLRMICNSSSWGEWNPDASEQKLFIQQFDDHELKEDNFMRCTKIVSHNKLKYYRFSHLNADNTGWVLFWNVDQIAWSFHLVQPKYRHDECLLTCIFGLSDDIAYTNIIQHMSFMTFNIKDAVETHVSRICPFQTPLAYLSEQSHNSAKLCPRDAHARSMSFRHRKLRENRTSSDSEVKVFKLIPSFVIKHLTRREVKDFRIEVGYVMEEKLQLEFSKDKTLKTLPNVLKAETKECIPSINKSELEKHQKVRLNLSKSFSSYSCDRVPSNTEGPASLALRRTQTVSASPEVGNDDQLPFRPRWFSESNLSKKQNGLSKNFNSLENLPEEEVADESKSGSEEKEEEDDENAKNDSGLADTEGYIRQFSSDYEILLPQPELSDHRTADMLTKGNYCASQLQAEVLEASSINLQLSIEDQCSSSKGWSFHSICKGLTVLSKISHCGSLKILSYICEVEIPLPPSYVWKTIRNPHLRFICDETVKKVRVLEEISEDQKIIHTYHETNNLLKKETVDFCLLHTERCENSKYFLALQSMEYANCPLMHNTIRGTLLPSGWALQSANCKEDKTKVIYLHQIIVNNPNSHFINDLANSLPVSMYNMKNYVMLKPFCPVP